jgi:hypothetical protein
LGLHLCLGTSLAINIDAFAERRFFFFQQRVAPESE